jgi:hypothetical protein
MRAPDVWSERGSRGHRRIGRLVVVTAPTVEWLLEAAGLQGAPGETA